MAIFQKGLRKMTEKDWIKKVKSVHPKADGQVLQFIYDFRTMQKSETAEDAIYDIRRRFWRYLSKKRKNI